MPIAAFAGPLIGAIGSIGGAAISAHGAGKAGNQLSQMGVNVGNSLSTATQNAIDAANRGTGQATDALHTGLTDATGAIRGGVTDATGALQTGLRDATGAITTNYGSANDALTKGYDTQMGALAPYLQAGTQGLTQLASFLAPGGEGSKAFTADMMEQYDPGYQFRQDQGQRALESSAAARGGVLGGAAQKELARYSQDYASGEYQNAFNRHLAQNAQQFNMLSGLAGYGQHATDQAVGAAGDLARGLSGNYGAMGNLLGAANLATGQQIGAMNYGAGNAIANANLGTAKDLANTLMQGNQFAGQIGLQGTNMAGNAYMGGALGGATAAATSANQWGQGLANAGQQIGAGFSDYWNNRQQQSPLISASSFPALTWPQANPGGAGTLPGGFWNWGTPQLPGPPGGGLD